MTYTHLAHAERYQIEILRKRGYCVEIIIQKTGLSSKYIKDWEVLSAELKSYSYCC